MADKVYVRFELREPPRDAITQRWIAYSAQGMHSTPIGMVRWFSQWRRYCYFPIQGTLYDAACLSAIANFCETETTKHKESRKCSRA